MNNIPMLSGSLRLRKEDPIAYNSENSTIHKFNKDAETIIRLINGQRTTREIINSISADINSHEPIAEVVINFLELCQKQGLIIWKI